MKKLLAFFLVFLSAIAFNRCKPYDTVTVTDVTVNPATLALATGGSATLTAIVTPGNATIKSVIWSSDKPAVATVDVEGKVTAVADGTAIITATTMCGGFTATCEVTVMGTLEFTVGGVTFNMIPVEAGTFQMGSDDGDSDEKPVHQVTLTNDYWMGETEVTQELWKAVMGSNPSYFTFAKGYTDDLQRPVESVNWDDIQSFLTKLNSELSTELGGKHFALPTEAQWEFAARGGNSTHGYKYSGSDYADDVAWYWGNIPSTTVGEDGYGTQPVGTVTAANELGIYDMSGNVWEWCADMYSGSNRVNRGGSWDYDAGSCAVSYRGIYDPGYRYYNYGFRLALLP